MYKIPNYSMYNFNSSLELINLKNNKPQRLFKSKYKVKSDLTNKFSWKSRNTLLSSAGLSLNLPDDAKQVECASKYFVDTSGNVYSFNKNTAGVVLKPQVNTSGYSGLFITLDTGVRAYRDIHRLLCETFIMKDYVKRKLCCLHLNNNKTDNRLKNLAVGTYSENNKQAYEDGVNPGNGLKRKFTN